MSRPDRWQISVVSLCAAAVLLGLLASGLRGATRRTFAASTADIALVATLHAGQHICESPIQSEGAFGSAIFWNAGVDSSALVDVHAGPTASGPVISNAVLRGTTDTPGDKPAALTNTVDSSSPVTICVTEKRATMTLYGGAAAYGGPTVVGSNPGTALWLQLLSAKPKSLFAFLPVAFRRASLFRPTWVGAWTFWALLVALVAVVPLGLVGLRSALREESERE